ncbi:hypothetical protein [Luteibaculum oceani]|uniref:GLPGLI family protein n=1 Tax=Luteibaculum oceani TaxID=1294296 RepID=A0A5C6VAU3_9FLAO|nr:hypothetical protein [Luteibaculum oceani]TXC81990.1 hypothetical protein FRX97_02550 [Luteibaculum oceani]
MVKTVVFFVNLLVLTVLSFAQDQSFAVELQYSYSKTDSLNLIQQQFLPKGCILYGNDKRVVQKINFGMVSMIRIADAGSDSILNYVSAMGNKVWYKSPTPVEEKPFEIKLTDKKITKEAYTLDLAIGVNKGKKFPIYYLKGINTPLFPRFKHLAGVPLQYKLEGIEMGMDILVHILWYKNNIPNDLNTELPSGYRKATKEDFENFSGFFN